MTNFYLNRRASRSHSRRVRISPCINKKRSVENEHAYKLSRQRVDGTHLSHRALNVSNDGSVRVIQKFHTNLSDVAGIAGLAENLVHLSELNWLILLEITENAHVNY